MMPPVPPGSPLVLLEDVALTLASAAGPGGLAAAEGALARVGLGHRLGHYPGQLSGGEQQRVAMARAFVAGPVLLLADEPTGNLDGATGRVVIDCLFEEHGRRGSGLLLITHEAGLAERCDRQLHLEDGRIVGETRPTSGQLRALSSQRRGR